MRRTLLALCAVLAVATPGCSKIKEAIDRKRGKKPPATAAQPAPRDTTKQPAAAAPKPAAPPPSTPATPPRSAVAPVEDTPYASADTGTVNPGMTEQDVIALWGAPVASRTMGEMTYLYFRNGCERSCGTMDVVFLQGGQVVDAIVRWPGHGYSGQSSSPAGGRPPEPTPPQ